MEWCEMSEGKGQTIIILGCGLVRSQRYASGPLLSFPSVQPTCSDVSFSFLVRSKRTTRRPLVVVNAIVILRLSFRTTSYLSLVSVSRAICVLPTACWRSSMAKHTGWTSGLRGREKIWWNDRKDRRSCWDFTWCSSVDMKRSSMLSLLYNNLFPSYTKA